jgi:RNA polymerase sigma-32 factor
MARKSTPPKKASSRKTALIPEVLDAESSDSEANLKSKNPAPSAFSSHSDDDHDEAPLIEDAIDADFVDLDEEISDLSPDADEDEDASSLPSLRSTRAAVTKKGKQTYTDVGSGSTAISVSDPLRRFIEEVRKIPLLEPEEELELALRLQRTGDVDAARRLVQANLRLVVKIAFEYRSVYANVMDLIQEGNLGLMKGVAKYDASKGARLGYYASWWIRSYILKYLLDNFRLVKVGTTQAQKKLFFHLMREKERLEAQGAIPTPKLLASRLNVKENEVLEMEQRLSSSGSEVSIDFGTPTKNGEKSRKLSDSIPSLDTSAEERLIQSEWLNLLEDELPAFERTLNEKERKLLQERLLAETPKTLQEVADLYGLTRERARQIEVKVIEKLREFLKDHF